MPTKSSKKKPFAIRLHPQNDPIQRCKKFTLKALMMAHRFILFEAFLIILAQLSALLAGARGRMVNASTFTIITKANPKQQKAFDLLQSISL